MKVRLRSLMALLFTLGPGYLAPACTHDDPIEPYPDGALADGASQDRPGEGDASSPPPDGTPPANDADKKTLVFKQHVVDAKPDRPAFVTSADLNGDKLPELVVSVFAGSSPTVMGNGLLATYSMKSKGALGAWSRQVLVSKLKGIKFPNAASAVDVDGDKDLDLFLPYGFLACAPFNCGGLAWLENTGAAKGWKWHDVVAKGSALFYHHVALVDLDGDKVKDAVTVGESKGLLGPGKAETRIFLGDASAPCRFKKKAVVVGPGLGSLPTVLDIDGDGDLDIASAEYFVSGESAAWYERTGASIGAWKKHVIASAVGPSIQLSFIKNLHGKGKLVPVLSNHTNTADKPADPESGLYLLKIPPDPTKKWVTKKISAGIKSRKSPLLGPQAAPGVFSWGDLDGDKDIDLLVSGDGDPDIYWLEQLPGGAFKTHVLAKNLPQSGVTAVDLDGDGVTEAVVSSYEANKLLVFDGSWQ
jgi:hypothetical protein